MQKIHSLIEILFSLALLLRTETAAQLDELFYLCHHYMQQQYKRNTYTYQFLNIYKNFHKRRGVTPREIPLVHCKHEP